LPNKSKYYVVWVGREPGIYRTWAECAAQVDGFPNAKFKSFPGQAQAQAAFQAGWPAGLTEPQFAPLPPDVITDSISVDAACDGSPGRLEYRGVETQTGREIFRVGPLENGTNNLGEFLAIVHALALLQKEQKSSPIYSDSASALAWVRRKAVGSTLPRSEATEAVWQLVDRALTWLNENEYPNPLLKWRTGAWSEIRADFGRK
jgi:ribonuclease HI